MSRVPLRLRLTAVFAVAMALVLAAGGVFLHARVASDLGRALDQELRSRAQDLSALVRRDGSLEATSGSLIERGESFAQLVAADGRVLDATRPLGSTRLLEPAELAAAPAGPTFADRPSVPGLDEPARLLAIPLGDRVLIVGATRENRAETLRSLRAALLVGGPVALLLASLGRLPARGRRAAPDRGDAPPGGRDLGQLARTSGCPCRRLATRSPGSASRSTRCSHGSRTASSANDGSSPTRATSCGLRWRCCAPSSTSRSGASAHRRRWRRRSDRPRRRRSG